MGEVNNPGIRNVGELGASHVPAAGQQNKPAVLREPEKPLPPVKTSFVDSAKGMSKEFMKFVSKHKIGVAAGGCFVAGSLLAVVVLATGAVSLPLLALVGIGMVGGGFLMAFSPVLDDMLNKMLKGNKQKTEPQAQIAHNAGSQLPRQESPPPIPPRPHVQDNVVPRGDEGRINPEPIASEPQHAHDEGQINPHLIINEEQDQRDVGLQLTITEQQNNDDFLDMIGMPDVGAHNVERGESIDPDFKIEDREPEIRQEIPEQGGLQKLIHEEQLHETPALDPVQSRPENIVEKSRNFVSNILNSVADRAERQSDRILFQNDSKR